MILRSTRAVPPGSALRRCRRTALAGLLALATLPLATPASAALPAAGLPAALPAADVPTAGLPAAALPAAGRPATAAAPASAPASAAALPVTVTVTGLEPRDLEPDSAITVTAVLRNTGREATGPLRVRLERGALMTTRGELDQSDDTPPPTGSVATPTEPVDDGVAPGRTRTVTLRSTVAGLRLIGLGVYPLALSVLDDSGEEVGRARTTLPYFPPSVDVAKTRVALFWPLLDRPHQLTSSTVFDDDLLARTVSRGGRLDRLLRVAESVTGTVRLTLAVDPETIEELGTMVSGYRVTDGPGGRDTVPGRNGAAAAEWLARLRRIAPEHQLMVVPFGDPDVVALERGSLVSLGHLNAPDVAAVQRALGVRPATEVAWPPDGQLTDTTLDDVVNGGATAVVLDPTALSAGTTPESGATQSGVSPLQALGGPAVALVPDATVQQLVTSGAARTGGFPGGQRLGEQRLLAELAMITAERPSDPRTLVIAPPRRWDPAGDYGAALVKDLGGIRWLESTTALEAAGSTGQVRRGSLIYPATAQRHEVSTGQIAQIGAVQALVTDFRSALSTTDASTELAPYGDAVRRAGSSAWRGDQQAGRAYAARLRRQIGALRGRVTMTAPSSGVYTLTSSDSPLVITVQNDLTVPVAIRVRMTVPPGFTVKDEGVVAIAPGEKRILRLTTSVQRTGTFAIRGQVTTPARGALGEEIKLSIRSTAYGGLAVGVTGLAFAFLVGAVLVRLVRRLRARGTEPPVAAGSPADRSLS